MASAGEKSLAVGHISGFQIDPNWSSVSDFLFLLTVILLLHLFQILASGIRIGFDFPRLLGILPDGFELGIGLSLIHISEPTRPY